LANASFFINQHIINILQKRNVLCPLSDNQAKHIPIK